MTASGARPAATLTLPRMAVVMCCLVLCAIAAAPAHGALSGTWCGTERGQDDTAHQLPGDPHKVKVVYAYPADQPSRFSYYADVIQHAARDLAQRFERETAGEKTLRLDLGTSCGPAFVDIQSVRLPRNLATYMAFEIGWRFQGAVQMDLAPALGPAANRDFLVLADYLGADTGATTGIASRPADSSPGPGNVTNSGGRYAFLFGKGTIDFIESTGPRIGNELKTLYVRALHELTHLLGGVSRLAPNSDHRAHCLDGRDVMCDTATQVVCDVPASDPAYDCNRDDYFNPAPPPGSYLDTHWNVYDSMFLCPALECAVFATPPVAHVRASDGEALPGSTGWALPASPAETGRFVRLDASGSLGATRFRFDLDGDGDFERNTGATPSTAVRFDTPGLHEVSVKATNDAELGDMATVGILVSEPLPTARQSPAARGAPKPRNARKPRGFALSLTLTPRKQRRTGVSQKGLLARVRVGSAAKVTITARVSRKDARRYRLPRRLARVTRSIPAGRKRSIRLRLRGAAKRRILRVHRLPVLLRASGEATGARRAAHELTVRVVR